jgi:hypothetical protein
VRPCDARRASVWLLNWITVGSLIEEHILYSWKLEALSRENAFSIDGSLIDRGHMLCNIGLKFVLFPPSPSPSLTNNS